MNKHKFNIILSLFLSALVLVCNYFFEFPLVFLLFIIVVHIGIVLYGILNLDFNYFFDSITAGDGLKKEIVLSFDDGPLNQTRALLSILAQEKTPAIFFCVGKNIDKYPEIVKEIAQDGHIIGKHSYSHDHKFDFYSSEKVLAEINQCNEAIFKIIGKRPLLFRPPNGVSNPMIAKALLASKLKSIAWNVRTFDTQITDVDKLYKQTIKKIKPGAIILMHDTMPNTRNLVSKLITYCNETGYEIVALDKLLNINVYE